MKYLEYRVLATVVTAILWVWTTTGCMGWISSKSNFGVLFGALGAVGFTMLSIRLLISIWRNKKENEKDTVSSGTGTPDLKL